jgi:glycosyltransferase involved in cell wall biosynthesis
MKVCMVAYTFYENDGRVLRYAETFANRGDYVDVVALRRRGQSKVGRVNGVNIYRIQKREINEKNKFSYLWRISKFLINSGIFLTKKSIRTKYDLIHIHSVPDFEVFAAIIAKFMGSKIILDIHDIVPEFYASKFNADHGSFLYKTLIYLEKLSIAFCHHIIISNHIWEKTLVSRSVKPAKCTTIMNYPDTSIFFKRSKKRSNDDKFLLLYPGTLNWHQGLDLAIKAFAIISEEISEAEFHIYGEGPTKSELAKVIEEYKLTNRVLLKEPVSMKHIADVMANADLGIIPKRNDGFGGEAFSTKSLEFMSLGVPIIISKTKIDQYYFNDSIVKFFEPGNEKDLANAMLLLMKNRHLREELSQSAFKFVAKNNWDVKKSIYLKLVDSLVFP